MQIPIQEKIAELETRIAKLEKAHGVRYVSEIRSVEIDGSVWTHFDRIFLEMNEIFKKVFG